MNEQDVISKSVFENAGIAIVVIEEDTTISSANPYFEKLSGYSRGEIEGKMKWTDTVVPEDLERMEEFHRKRRKDERTPPSELEFRFINKQGKIRHILVKVGMVPGTGKSIASLLDITEIKQTEEELRRHQRLLNDVQRITKVGGWEYDLTKNTMIWTDEVYRIHGLSREDYDPNSIERDIEFYLPEDRKRVRQAFQNAVNKGESYDLNLKLMSAKGEELWVRTIGYPVFEGGKVTRVFGNIIDITEGKQAEEQLRKSKETYRILTEESPLAVSLIGRDGRYKYINPKFTQLFGYTLEDIPSGREWFRKAFPDEEYRKDIVATWISDKKKYAFGEARPRTYEVTCADGSKKTIHFKPTTMESGDQLVIYEDLTETQRLEEQLRQAQKVEAIGRLAGGVAHDFNNLLTTIMGNTDMALMKLNQDDSLYEPMEEIRDAGKSASQLTRQLLAFSRKQVLQPEVLELNQLVMQMEKMLRRLIGEDIELTTTLEPDLRKIEADPAQIEQIIMNLSVNARDAMPQGGRLTIETANADLDEAYSRGHGGLVTPGPYVMLAVSDTGLGMPAEVREHVFEPFFTTKGKGEGTGLGLSTVYGIVKQSKGFIWVYSEPGRGTSFKIYLPKAEKEASEEEWRKEKLTGLKGSEKILVVEDDERVRNTAVKMLSRYGYTVLTASNGQDALQVMKEHKGEIDVLLTDVVMPGMSGKETVEKLKALYPGIKVVYMSGYTDNAIVHHGVLDKDVAFVQKPFTSKDLAAKVREVLDL